MRTILTFCICFFVFQSVGYAAPQKDRFYYETRGEVVWEVSTDEKVIALTFDDGPHPSQTPQILDLLKQYHAKATFFVVGNKIKLYPDVLKREVDEGHEIANHTYTHAFLSKRTNMKKEINKTDEIIYSVAGIRCHLFRPPGGFYNERLVNIVKQEGHKMIMWSWHLDPRDWSTPGVNKIVNKVLNNSSSGDIVLFHDYVEGKTQTIEALQEILPELEKRGYRFVTVSELLTYRKAVPAKKP
ncbi:polysaccharide deacetylase family protein [Paenibacillus roseipurpureus]|uniref:Polysaccharide deacetylase family protein n=1 Tax=Paenibacillus roseopurpureus TaxID=2918901 RepID=A0AA96LT23_9BACL|nr:polysaccharide deacetylase family protein [Paenibacillus sp. MBLB1832]WNR46793.1 polysaccharide deacetylase family protein [Paenibacillus sp. MBLB1832]